MLTKRIEQHRLRKECTWYASFDRATQQSVLFAELLDKPLNVKFDQPHCSSDGGASLLAAVVKKLDYTASLARCLKDKRNPALVTESYHMLYLLDN